MTKIKTDQKIYQQVLLQRPTAVGRERIVAWIEQKGVKVGAQVEVLDKEGWISERPWTVKDTYDTTLTEDQLKESQRDARTYAKRTDI